MEPKYTSKGLPIISQETLEAMVGRYTGRKSGQVTHWGTYLSEVQQRLAREDPVLVKFLEIQVGKFPRELHTPLFEVLVGLYAALESQTEANRLNREFGK